MPEQVSEEEKQERLDRVERRASAYDYEFSGCGQMVMLSLQQEFKLPWAPAVFKSATFLGRGTSGVGGACGALIGGVLAIGLASGRDKIEDSIYPEPEVLDATTGFPQSLEIIRKYYKRWKEELGSFQCKELQTRLMGKSYDHENKEDAERFHKEGGREKCSELVGKAARIAAEIIMELPRR